MLPNELISHFNILRFATNPTLSWCATCWTTACPATWTRHTRRWTTSGSWVTPLRTSSPTSSGSARTTTRWPSTSSSSSSRRSALVTWGSLRDVARSSRWLPWSQECARSLKKTNVNFFRVFDYLLAFFIILQKLSQEVIKGLNTNYF